MSANVIEKLCLQLKNVSYRKTTKLSKNVRTNLLRKCLEIKSLPHYILEEKYIIIVRSEAKYSISKPATGVSIKK